MVLINDKQYERQVLRKRIRRYTTYGGLMTGVGGGTAVLLPMLLAAVMDSQLMLKEGSLTTAGWAHPPIPLDMQMYIWNIENPDEFSRGAKAKLKEMGPYVYKMTLSQEIINWESEDRAIKHWVSIGWEFNQDKTVGSLDDKITVPNVPVYSMLAVARHLVRRVPLGKAVLEPIVMGSLNILIYSHGLGGLINRITVRELLEGYHYSLLYYADFLIKYASGPLKWLGIEIPEMRVSDHKLGYLSIKNYTRNGPYHVYTGQKGTKFLKTFTFGGKTEYDVYDDPRCNMFNGTIAPIAPFPTKDTKLYMFIGEFCRSIYFTYKESSSVAGMPTYRFHQPPGLYASPDKNADNNCFCTAPEDYAMCDGIFDLGPCYFGAPIAVSHPHFLYASDKIRDNVDGMDPDVEKHESYLQLQPTLGTPLGGQINIQANLLLEPIGPVVGFGGVREAVLPFVWVQVKIELEGLLLLLASLGVWPLVIIEYASRLAFFGGLAGLGYTSLHAFNHRKTLFPAKPKPNPTDDMRSFGLQINGIQSEVKKPLTDKNVNSYPDEKPPQYSASEQENKYKVWSTNQSLSQQSPLINGFVINQKSQTRYYMTPPGSAE